MKKLFKAFLSLEIMILFLLLLAFSSAVATFVENDFGPLGAKSFIYGTTWFESIMIFLIISVLANIVYFKMYKIKKFTIFMIHISFVFLLIGAGLTRYYGYEGIMTIPENSMQNRMLSSDEYIQMNISKDTQETKYEKKVLMTQLSQTKFEDTIKFNNKDLTIKFNRFVPNAIEKIVPDKNGEAIINLIVTKFDGANSFELKGSSSIETELASFTLNKSIVSDKPTVNFTTDSKNVYLESNLEISISNLKGKRLGSIPANTKQLLDSNYLFTVAQTKFITPEFSAKGKLDVVSKNRDEIKENENFHAVVLDINYNNQVQTAALFGNGGQSQGFKNLVKFDDISVELQWGAKIITLPFSILLNDFKLNRYAGSNAPSSFSSDVKIYDKELKEPIIKTIYMNNPLDYRGFRFFQSSYKEDESATILSVNKDPGKVPTYIGYFLLFTGLILNLFSKNGRFRKLLQKKYTIENVKKEYLSKIPLLFLALTFCCNTNLNANDNIKIIKNIDIKHANNFGSMLIQDYQGRIKPLNSLAIEITNKISRTNNLFGLNENQIFLSMLLYPKKWQELKFVKVSNKEVNKILNIKDNEKMISFSNIYDKNGNYVLESYLEKASNKKDSQKTKFDKEVIKIDERLNIAYKVFTGGFLKFFPKLNDKNNLWLDPVSALNSQDILNDEKNDILILMEKYLDALQNSIKSNDYKEANKTLNDIRKYQKEYGNDVLKNDIKIKAELLFNKLDIFNNLTLYYLFFGLTLLIFVFIKIFNPNKELNRITRFILLFFLIGFILHTLGLILRWYIAEYAPWSNAYESMIYISWALILSGMLFSRTSQLALATTGVLSSVILFVAHLSWMEPQITSLVPVLKSYWLTIHVSVITASYGFFGLSALLGFITLILYSILNPKNENEKFFSIITSIKETRRINEMSIFIGLALLVIGNFLGGIWANESWGRYWGWDPKETWTLVSILIYSIIIHLHYIKKLNTNFIFSSLCMIAYSSIIMTYFGVNYYLSGKHSYAAGDAIPIPTFVPVGIAIMLLIILLGFKNRKVI